MESKTVLKILKEYLVSNGYDGLVSEGDASDDNCACLINNLAPCGSYWVLECYPAYTIKCKDKSNDCEDSSDCEYSFCLSRKKGTKCSR